MIKMITSGFPLVRMTSLLSMIVSCSALFLPSTALACSCAPISAPEHVAGNEIIFKGTIVVRQLTEPKDDIFGNGVVYYFKVEKTWKGTSANRISVSVPTTKTSLCGVKLPLGWTGVVFAGEDEGKIITGLCAMLPYHLGQLENYDKLLPGHR